MWQAMDDQEIKLQLSMAIFGVAITQAMLAHDLRGRIEPGVLTPDQDERLKIAMEAMCELHAGLAELSVELQRQARQ
ncbi:MAG: hypothetical protein QOF78_969 [Phycisphaerales bacterium]|jgi:hypothetical protein|nr:hypothetical protein [Phycisphaerales bacterium]